MVIMAQSAANWRNTHTLMDSTQSLTQLHQHSYSHMVIAQLLFFSACWVFSCFRNPPNFDKDYRIFIMRM